MANEKKAEEFRKEMQTIAAHGVLSLAIAFGFKLELFDSLAKISSKENPKTAKEVAEVGRMKARFNLIGRFHGNACEILGGDQPSRAFPWKRPMRLKLYVKEWLNTMACGSIIRVDESGEKFWIPEERVKDLTHENPHSSVAFQEYLPILARVSDQMSDVFKKEGPLGMDRESYTDFYKIQNRISTAVHKEHLLGEFLPLTGLQAHLEAGVIALDVGCGAGFHVCYFAEHFSNSKFTGIDITKNALDLAAQTAKSRDLSNATFALMDGSKLLANWTDKFDWVSIFDSCHDQQRPDKCLKEIHRVLKLGGVFSMLENKGSSNPFTDHKNGGLGAAYCYGISMFHCLPVASNSKDALCLGSMWGQRRAVALLNAAGFSDVKVIPTPFFPMNVLYLCTKNKESSGGTGRRRLSLNF